MSEIRCVALVWVVAFLIGCTVREYQESDQYQRIRLTYAPELASLEHSYGRPLVDK